MICNRNSNMSRVWRWLSCKAASRQTAVYIAGVIVNTFTHISVEVAMQTALSVELDEGRAGALFA